jgi:predicted ATPase
LAIEFAAARAAVLGAPQVASYLDNRFTLLTSGRRNALSRHRTLRAALDWSYDLLPDPEKCLLRRLAVFAGGFTIEAATAVMVMDDGDNSESPVMDGITRLAEKSLITRDGSIAGRWRVLETIRAYAREKLMESGEAEQTARRHAEFFRDLFAAPTPEAQLKSGIRDMSHSVREIDEVRAALDWAFSPLGDPVVGIVLTAAYAPVWMRLSLVVECRERTGRALDSLKLQFLLDARLTMRLYTELAAAAVYSEEETRDILGRALELAEGMDDEVSQLRAIWAIWSDRNLCGDYQGAQLFAERFAMVARRVGDPADILVSDRLVGTTMHYRGNQAKARHYLERVLALYVAPSDHRHTIWFYHNQRALARLVLARVRWLQGFLDQARHDAQSSLEDAHATDNALSIRYVLGWAVFPIALMTKDFAAAERSLATFIDISATALPYWKIWGGSLQGTLLIKRGEFAAGSALLSAALDTSFRPGRKMRFPDFLGILAEGLAGLGRLTEAHVTIEEAIERSNRDGERWCLAELLRIKGELLLKEATAQPFSAAEDCFVGAIDLAREQDALFWELRAALSLAQLWRDHGQSGRAKALLQPVYDQFTEGFDTTDLKAGKALLDALE